MSIDIDGFVFQFLPPCVSGVFNATHTVVVLEDVVYFCVFVDEDVNGLVANEV